jgi:hypothetical protein
LSNNKTNSEKLMPSYQNDPIIVRTTTPSGPENYNGGIYGESTIFNGVLGQTTADGHAGVAGVSDEGNSNGVYGRSKNANGVVGYSSSSGNNGVAGVNLNGGTGVFGNSQTGIGVFGLSETWEAVHAETKSATVSAIAAYNFNPEGTGSAIFGKKEGNAGFAGFFDGNVWVSKTISVGADIVLANADCAEDFDIADLELVQPGTVMVIDADGALRTSDCAYDKRVAGVISGAGLYKPGIVLDKQESSKNRMPIALMGKVYCKVDASYGAIKMGDLLTTSPTPGHAMRTDDPMKAFGAVIGKALRPLESGQDLIPILIALQ